MDCEQADPIIPLSQPEKPLPPSTPKKNIVDFLSQQKKQCQGQGSPEVWMYVTIGYGKGGYTGLDHLFRINRTSYVRAMEKAISGFLRPVH